MQKNKLNKNKIEEIFEKCLWNMRFFSMFAVLFSLLSSLLLFIVSSLDVYKAFSLFVSYYFFNNKIEHFHELIIGKIIASIDLYLIAIVLLIFSFGIYELFISKIDIAQENESSGLLKITSLDELKNKITKVIIMVLIVSFFQRILTMEYKTPLEMMYFAVSIFVLSLGLYFLLKNDHK